MPLVLKHNFFVRKRVLLRAPVGCVGLSSTPWPSGGNIDEILFKIFFAAPLRIVPNNTKKSAFEYLNSDVYISDIFANFGL